MKFRFFILGSVLIASCANCCAQSPEDGVRGLARRVAEIHELPQALTLEWTNVSSLPEAESIILREAFLQEFSSHHSLAAEPSAAALHVSLRETPTKFLVVADVATATGEQVRMAELARTSFLPVMTRGNGLRLAKQLLWQQAETILDAGEFADEAGSSTASAANIFLLKPDGVAIYREADERLSEIQELPFGGYKYVSRGLRGEMRRTKDGGIAVAVPGLNCTVRAVAIERWTMACAAAASAITEAKNAGTAVATNGEAVALTSSCDASSWRLIGEATDWTQMDRLLLVNGDLKRAEAVAALEFAGPVRSLVDAEDEKSAVAVVFNLSSGSYEVYRVAMVCGR